MKKQKVKFIVVAFVISVSIGVANNPLNAAVLNQTCKKVGATSTARSKGKIVKVKCSKVGNRLRWVQVKTTSSTIPTATVSQKNAARSAASYLRTSAFSRSGLIKQLEFEGFSPEDSAYGADAQKADWNAQAVKSGASYLRTSAFSRSGLVKQLEFEGFSNSEAIFGADGQKADWNSQAAKSAAAYLKVSSFSRSGLINQLIYEGFSQSEAEYGVSTTGL